MLGGLWEKTYPLVVPHGAGRNRGLRWHRRVHWAARHGGREAEHEDDARRLGDWPERCLRRLPARQHSARPRRARSCRCGSPITTPVTWLTPSGSRRSRASCWPRYRGCAWRPSPTAAPAAAPPASTTWSSRNPPRELGQRKATAVAGTGADLLVTGNPGCAMQITSALAAGGTPMPTAHIAEVLDAWRRFAMQSDLVIVDAILGCFRVRTGQLTDDMKRYHARNRFVAFFRGDADTRQNFKEICEGRLRISSLAAPLRRTMGV